MAQQGPNPIDAYQGAVQQLHKAMEAVAANQLNSSTPCSEWDVQSLINHALAVQGFANAVLSGGTVDPSTMGNVSHPLPSEGPGNRCFLFRERQVVAVLAELVTSHVSDRV